MDALQALYEWETRPHQLVVRNFVDLTNPQRRLPEVLSLLLNYDGGSWSSIELKSAGGVLPSPRAGSWSDRRFRFKHLHPRLEAHPLWLCTDQIRTVAKLPGDAEVVAPPLGRLLLQHLQLSTVALTLAGSSTFANRLAAILREYNRGLNHWELLT